MLVLGSLLAQGQDVILKNNGDELKVKVLEINLSYILYKLPANGSDSVFQIGKAEVFMVSYANGQKDVMSASNPVAESPAPRSPAEFTWLGRQDARRYYSGNKALWGSMAASTIGFLPVPIVVAVMKPKMSHEAVSDVVLLANPAYVRAYQKQAHRTKVGQTALGTALGLVCYGLLINAAGPH